jgi:hypothetical protein
MQDINTKNTTLSDINSVNGLDILSQIKKQYPEENIPSNDDIDIADVTFTLESAQMATSNLTVEMFC